MFSFICSDLIGQKNSDYTESRSFRYKSLTYRFYFVIHQVLVATKTEKLD